MRDFQKIGSGRRGATLALILPFVFSAAVWPCLRAEAQVGAGVPQSRAAVLDGSRVSYKSYGQGNEAIVFVHGWTCDLTSWRGQAAAFDGKTRLILIDLPGHGQSDKPQIQYTMDLFARAVNAVLIDAGVDKAVLVGHSMGTPVVRQFYRKYPAKTRALVIVDGALRPMGTREQMEQFMAALRGPNYTERAGKFLDLMLATQNPPELRHEIKAMMLAAPQHVAISAMEAMIDPAIWGQDKIDVPVLAVMAKSPFWAADTEQVYRSIAPNLDFQMWDGAGHFLMMQKPDEFNRALASFLIKNGLLKK